MDDRLEEWCAHQRDFWSDLVTTDTGIRERWRSLVERTTPHVDPRKPWHPHLEAASAFNPPGPFFTLLSADLLDAWRGYGADWATFVDVNPRVAIADTMSAIAEQTEGASWPWSREREIEAWAREDRPLSVNLVGMPEQQERLRRAARETGLGWVHYDLERSRLVWR